LIIQISIIKFTVFSEKVATYFRIQGIERSRIRVKCGEATGIYKSSGKDAEGTDKVIGK
jgi:hypothetical protein